MTLNLSQVVGLYIIIEIAPYILLDLIIALLGILHGCVLILAQPLLHSSLKDMKQISKMGQHRLSEVTTGQGTL